MSAFDAFTERRAASPEAVQPQDPGSALQAQIGELGRSVLAQLRSVALAFETTQINDSLREASRIAPKDRRVVFIGAGGFAGNIKYAWLDFSQRAKALDIDCWFAPQTRDQEELMKALGVQHFPFDYTAWTREHTGLALRTAVRVIESHYASHMMPNPYQHALFSGAHEVQLWHGISIKEIALRAAPALGRMTTAHAQNLASCRMDVFCGSSAQAEVEWRRWFSFDRYANVGYPRNDVLLRTPNELDLLNVDTAALNAARRVRAAGRKVFFYAPTFRDGGSGAWLQPQDLNDLARGLAQQGHLLLVNFHPFEQPLQPQYEARCPGVGFVQAGTDIYPLLGETDALVTDYSSLMFDYLMTGQPVLFWRPDHEAYVTQSRALYDAKLDRPIGVETTTIPELVRACHALHAEPAELVINRHAMRERLFDAQDSDAARRTSELIAAEVERVLA